MSTNRIKGLEQGRAKYAYDCVLEVTEKDAAIEKKYKNGVIKKIPMLIKTNGLGNTLAFAKAKSGSGSDEKKAWDLAYKHLDGWFSKSQNKHFFENLSESESEQSKDFVYKVITLSSSDYRACTVEVLALCSWLKRFAEGLIDSEENE